MNIVIPMAGEGSRFAEAGFSKPKPFIDVNGVPMIARVMDNLKVPNAKYILIAQKKHIEKEAELVNSLAETYPVEFLEIDSITEGTACTLLYARKYINNDTPLLIANSDQIVDMSVSAFVEKCIEDKLDGSILTFVDKERNPKWSFAKIGSNGLVTEVQEKKPISDYATVGIYFFSHGKDFVNSAIDMIIANDRVNNEFYTCPTYNYAIRDSKKISIFNIESAQMHGLGTPADLELYLNLLSGRRFDRSN